MTDYIVWKDYYTVGDPSLDAQHKEIIDLISKLYVALRQGEGNRATKDILERLIQYTLNHFSQEEGIMKEVGYPGLAAQKAQHDHMRRRMSDLRTHLRLVTCHDVLYLLKEWWLEHVQSEDQKYSPYLAVAAH